MTDGFLTFPLPRLNLNDGCAKKTENENCRCDDALLQR
jgi:hypothetical protein